MPLMKCQRRNNAGWKWGSAGFCYIGPGAKDKALAQGRAIHSQKRDALSTESEILKRIIANREALQKGKRLRRPPVWRLPISVEAYYRQRLISLVNYMETVVNRVFMPQLPGIVRDAEAQRQRSDAWPTDIRKLFDDTTLAVDRAPIVEERLAAAVGTQTSDFNDKQWRKIVKSVLGVNVFGSEPWLNDELDSFAQENVALIKSIKSDTIRDIEGLAQRGVRDGVRHETIAKQIRDKFQATRRRAQLIARDQVSKLNGQLTNLRQTSLGITHYIWRSSDDERVRPTHRANDDRRFAWNAPPATGHPGQDINCRCWAEPDFETMFDEAPDTEVPTSFKITSIKAGADRIKTDGLPSTIEMVKASGKKDAATSWIQTSTLNRAWKRSKLGYIDSTGKGGNLQKRKRLLTYLKGQGNNAKLNMPVVQLNKAGNIVIHEGRETFAALRDLGVNQIPVILTDSDVIRFGRTFGLFRQGTKIGLRKIKGATTVAKNRQQNRNQ